MTGVVAVELYCKNHPIAEHDDIDRDIMDMLLNEELDYDVLSDLLRMNN